MTVHLRSLSVSPPLPSVAEQYPFTVPVIKALERETLAFPSDVTIFVGENGSGKSTLLEAVAIAAHAITVGSESVASDATLLSVKRLAERLRLTWNQPAARGFFMRSEDFFGYTKYLRALRHELERDIEAVDEEYSERAEFARDMAKMPFRRELAAMRKRYGEDLDARSHGESYFTLFDARLVPDGLYLLDEPEAPLSPMKQLTLLAMFRKMVAEHGSQFVIATHSPILMAYPDATIYGFDGGAVTPLQYDEVEHVRMARDFLKEPRRFLRHL